MIGAMPAVAVRHERRRAEKRTGGRRPSQLPLQIGRPCEDATPSPDHRIRNELFICGRVCIVLYFFLLHRKQADGSWWNKITIAVDTKGVYGVLLSVWWDWYTTCLSLLATLFSKWNTTMTKANSFVAEMMGLVINLCETLKNSTT